MLDSTSHKIIKKEFLGKTEGRVAADIDKTRKSLQALHSNMQVSKIKVSFEEPLTVSNQKHHS